MARGPAPFGFIKRCLSLSSSPINLIVTSDVNQNDRPALDNHLKGDSVADINRDRMQFAQDPLEAVEPERWMKGVDLQQFEGFFVLRKEFRMFFDESGGLFIVAVGIKNPEIH